MAMPGSATTWLWFGFIGMTLGTGYFLIQSRKARTNQQKLFVVTTLIPAIAAVSYFALITGYGVISMPISGYETVDIYWGRYVDWLLTTPLLLLDLTLIAKAERKTIYKLLGADLVMILGGLAGTMAPPDAPVRIAWWSLSTAAFIVLLYYLLGALSRRAAGYSSQTGSLFDTLRNLTLAVWSLYPLVWIAGTTSGFGLITFGVETALYTSLDLVAKIGFGTILFAHQDALVQTVQATTRDEV